MGSSLWVLFQVDAFAAKVTVSGPLFLFLLCVLSVFVVTYLGCRDLAWAVEPACLSEFWSFKNCDSMLRLLFIPSPNWKLLLKAKWSK